MWRKKKQQTQDHRTEAKQKRERQQAAAQLVDLLYSSVDGKRISKESGVKPSITSELTYGEIDVLAFIRILGYLKPKSDDIFYDLGCGTGKAVLVAGLAYPFEKCVGIELVEGLYDSANDALIRCHSALESRQRHIKRGPSSGTGAAVVSNGASESDDAAAALSFQLALLEVLQDAQGRKRSVEDTAAVLVARVGRRAYKAALHGHGTLSKYLQRAPWRGIAAPRSSTCSTSEEEVTATVACDPRLVALNVEVLEGDVWLLPVVEDATRQVPLTEPSAPSSPADSDNMVMPPRPPPANTAAPVVCRSTPTIDTPHAAAAVNDEVVRTTVGVAGDGVEVVEVEVGGVAKDVKGGPSSGGSVLVASHPSQVGNNSTVSSSAKSGVGGNSAKARPRSLIHINTSVLRPAAPMEFVHGDILAIDWSGATVVYAASLLFGDALMESVARRAERMRPGAWFITLKILPSPHFRVVHEAYFAMSWGSAYVYIYQRV